VQLSISHVNDHELRELKSRSAHSVVLIDWQSALPDITAEKSRQKQ
jgi:hypothetical protein